MGVALGDGDAEADADELADCVCVLEPDGLAVGDPVADGDCAGVAPKARRSSPVVWRLLQRRFGRLRCSTMLLSMRSFPRR